MGMAHCTAKSHADRAECGLAPHHEGACDFTAWRKERLEEIKRATTPPLKPYDPPPSHYATQGGMDPWAVWDAFDLDRYTANAVKYLLRAGKKDIAPRLEDLKKARNYINKAIEREELALRPIPNEDEF